MKKKNKLFYNYHYKHRYFKSKGAYCYILSPQGAKKIIKRIKHNIVPLDHIFTAFQGIDIKNNIQNCF